MNARLWLRLSVAAGWLLAASGCGDTGSDGATGGGGEGLAGGACFANDTCFDGLDCVSGICEAIEAGGLGSACYPNGTCDTGWVCSDGLCVTPGSVGSTGGAGNAGGDDTSDTGDDTSDTDTGDDTSDTDTDTDTDTGDDTSDTDTDTNTGDDTSDTDTDTGDDTSDTDTDTGDDTSDTDTGDDTSDTGDDTSGTGDDPPCSDDAVLGSSAGCSFWAVDLDQHVEAQGTQVAVVIANASDATSDVTISTRKDGASVPEVVASGALAEGAVAVFPLPQTDATAGVSWAAFHIESTRPVVAYQFNPLDNDSFSSDATLLLPAHALGKSYLAVSRAELLGGGPPVGVFDSCATVCSAVSGGQCLDDGNGGQVCVLPYRGTVSVVATEDATEVTVAPTAPTLAGPGAPAISTHESKSFTLHAHQVLTLASDEDGGDLTGTSIIANRDVVVFGGHQAAVTSDVCCADHLEHQLPPTTAWGQTYVAAKSMARGVEPDYWRIVAAEDDTTVSFSPAVAAQQTLDAGGWVELATASDVVIQASAPVMVTQFLASSQEVLVSQGGAACVTASDCHPGYSCDAELFTGVCLPPSCAASGSTVGCPEGHVCNCFEGGECQCSAMGDPSLIVVPAIDRYQSTYRFLTPSTYLADFVTIVAPANTQVLIDGVGVAASNFASIPGSTYAVARVAVSDGTHELVANKPVGLTVYGWDRDVSYGYAGGIGF